MLHRADLGPEEGEDVGSVWSGFSTEEMQPVGRCGSRRQAARVLGAWGGMESA